jgi:hypothetical protein
MKLAVTVLLVLLAGISAFGQGSPTLRVVTDDPNLPSELYYGNVKVKPLRVRPGTNPPQIITINDVDFFVQEQYIDFFSRMPDQSGFNFWNADINNCSPKPGCTDLKRSNVSAAFFVSVEFQQTGYLVERIYRSAYGNTTGNSTIGGSPHTLTVPIIRFNEFLPDTRTIGSGLIVGQPGWETVLENNKQAFTQAFVQRQRFVNAFPLSMTPADFVDKLNQNANNALDAGQRTNAINFFGGAADSSNTAARAQALRQVAEDLDLYNDEYNRAFVLMQYMGYLRRDPDSGPDTDYSGYDFWLKKLNAFNGDYIKAQMVRSFLVSGEYLGRF